MKTKIQQQLFSLQDTAYRDFHKKLIPTTYEIIGVRTPILRLIAKKFAKQSESNNFINILPHQYYEEMNLHAFLIEQCNDFQEAFELTQKFLPYIDNWATCDVFKPKVFSAHLDDFFKHIQPWLNSKHTYTVRYAIVHLLRYYLAEKFTPEILLMVSEIKSTEYYINMAIAWFFSVALVKQYQTTIPLFEIPQLDKWTHNKAIQKAIESNRVDCEAKQFLRSLKIK